MHIVELLKAFLLAIDAVRVETPLPDAIVRVAVNGGGQTQAVQHPAAPGMPLIFTQDRDNLLCAALL